ncbi:DUF1360 domain-containing protein [Bacillus sp. 165]|uniref:DUF1360 domain-containing protein n=1 Tax=Bacillus sp. 165 TaxID=1529117 RepID=UPI001ADD4305|nr:DUF1360 domain-containing protein [Bacillus sp. 165]MBO9128624.1 DUF1360 domain-containing protein [Bacillus sp. 165]
MFTSWFLLVIFAFASFRLTRLLVFDKITKFIRVPFIEEKQVIEEDGEAVTYIRIKGRGIQKFIGELLSCYWCTGIWSTAFLLIIYYYIPKVAEPLLLLLAVAGIAAVIEVIVSKLKDE